MDFNGTNHLLQFFLEEWILITFMCIIAFGYFYYTNTFDHFEKRNVKYMKPVIIFGNSFQRILGKRSFIMFQLDVYKYFKGNPYGGIFEGRRPILYILDPDLIKAITIRDFDHFIDRVLIQTKEPKYMSRSLIQLQGSEWKTVRSMLSPAFSSGRIKNMFPLIQQCTNQMTEFLTQYDKTDVEIKDLMINLTLEVTGVCIFGISTDTLKEPNTEFKKLALNFNAISMTKRLVLFFILLFMPPLLKYVNISFLNYEANQKLVNILQRARFNRISSGTTRNDFLQQLIDAALKEKENIANAKNERYLDDDTLDAQALIFFIGGFETTSTTLSFAVYILAVYPQIQEKLRKHIEEVTKGEELCYDHLAEMDYLEAVILETLRMYPPLTRVERKCTKPYTLPGTSVQIEVGDTIAIPLYGIHMDPDIYPDPEKFVPERFTRGKKNETLSHLYLAFGVGPRSCIGARFALVVVKAAIATLLRSYKFSICPKTEVPIQFHKRSFLLKAEKGIWVHVDKI